MSSTLSITPQQIIDHRAARKAAGLAGCISGRPVPEMDFFGYRDVQSWRPADPMNPHCFCFDCRDLWDKDAAIDLQLITDGNMWARETYAQLLPMDMRPVKVAQPEGKLSAVGLLMRSNGGGIDMLCSNTRGVSLYPDDDAPAPPASVPLLSVTTEQPRYGSFSEVPTSLPAPRARDIMNESPQERLRADLAILRGQVHSDLVVAMDRARHAICYDDADERAAFLARVRADEQVLQNKLAAIDLLLKD